MEEKVSSDSFNSTKNITIKNNKAAFIELLILVFFVVINLISNVIAGKVLTLPFGLSVAGASLLFPLTSLIDDINTNCLGYQSAKRMTWISLIANLFMSVVFMAVVAWPAPVWFPNSGAFAIVLSQSIRIVIASLVAFAVSSFTNSFILQKMKGHFVDKGGDTMNRWHIFLRTFGSSIPAQLLDSFIFTFVAFLFAPGFTAHQVLIMALTQWGVKLIVELCLQPILVYFIPWFSKKTGLDVVDRDGFNPFKLG